MTPLATLFVEIGANVNGFKKGLDEVDNGVNKTSSKLKSFASGIGSTLKWGALGGATALAGLSAAVGTTGFSFNAFQESAETAFTTMLGGAEEAKAFLADLNNFAKTTPFEITGLTETSQKLLAFGFEADEILPTLTSIGDAVAGLGGSPELLNRVTIALGQIKAKGKVQAEEMLQLTEAGIPAWEMLAEKIGVSIPEAMEMVSKGMVSSEMAIGALTEGMNDRFGGLMEKQSKTWSGMLSTFKDYFAQISGRIMEPFFELATKGLAKILEMMESPQFEAFIENFIRFIETSTPKVVGFIEQIMNFVGNFASWVAGINILKPTNEVTSSLAAIGKGFVDLLKGLNELYPQWDEHLGLFFKVLFITVGEMIKLVVGLVKDIIDTLNHLVRLLIALKNGDWSTVWTEFTNIVSTVFGAIGRIIDAFTSSSWGTNLVNSVRNILPEWGNLWESLKTPLSNFGSIVAQALAPFANQLTEMLVWPMKQALNSVIDLHNNLIRTVNRGMSFIPGSSHINIPEIPKFGTGGLVFGSNSIIVGDKGPEMLTVPNGTRVRDHGQTMGMLNNSGGASRLDVYIHNNGSTPLGAKAIDEIAVALQKKLVRQGNKIALNY